ncbi:MAG: hypothetical protein Q7R66_02365 [Undibacterium sp.]|uniref:hypothetical protein n=1 Tax=Undibacterium sp. TaxID=1914977 RepID=UPI0027246952|nr:hypothetical protein [Undibacterium sp.]MDO8651016.1 hypothetical protein [Undibacterium sp.]
MSCHQCQDLCIEYRIALPTELRKAIKIAHENIIDGTIEEILSKADRSGQIPFIELAKSGAWDDVLCYRFRCQECGEAFCLTAETYHGSGGSWKPERKGAIRAVP